MYRPGCQVTGSYFSDTIENEHVAHIPLTHNALQWRASRRVVAGRSPTEDLEAKTLLEQSSKKVVIVIPHTHRN